MTAHDFIAQRKPRWDALDRVVAQAQRAGVRRVAPDELDNLLWLYRSTSADLARLRSLDADDAVVERLNRLVARAHALVYRTPPRSLSIVAFYRDVLPRVFRETWAFTLASVLFMVAFFLMAQALVGSRPELVTDIVGGLEEEFSGAHRPGDFSGRFQTAPGPFIASAVTTNNIDVALRAFALGVTFGLGTVYVLIVNGAMLGGFAGAYDKAGLSHEFWMTVLPHGALELSAIAVAGGAGLLVGWSLWCPGRRTRFRALQEESLRAIQLAAGLVPAFIVAGLYEGFVTPSRALSPELKVALGAAAGVVFWLYLIFGGRRAPVARSAPAASAPDSA